MSTLPSGLVLPTPEQVRAVAPQDTDQAIGKIALGRDARAAVALRSLALAVIKAVNEVDEKYGVHDFLVKFEIVCKGPGNYMLNITDKNSTVAPDSVAADVAEALARAAGVSYHKPQRAIQMEFGDGKK